MHVPKVLKKKSQKNFLLKKINPKKRNFLRRDENHMTQTSILQELISKAFLQIIQHLSHQNKIQEKVLKNYERVHKVFFF